MEHRRDLLCQYHCFDDSRPRKRQEIRRCLEWIHQSARRRTRAAQETHRIGGDLLIDPQNKNILLHLLFVGLRKTSRFPASCPVALPFSVWRIKSTAKTLLLASTLLPSLTATASRVSRSEEHTSELQSLRH